MKQTTFRSYRSKRFLLNVQGQFNTNLSKHSMCMYRSLNETPRTKQDHGIARRIHKIRADPVSQPFPTRIVTQDGLHGRKDFRA